MAYTTIKKPSDYFNTVLYTGNGTTGRAVTGVGFQPDWLWIKTRDSGTDNHNLFDAVRGASKGIQSNTTNAEYTSSSVQESFDTDGFTLGDNGQVNGNGESLVAWNWLADNTSGSSNTDGSITSTVSANTTSGFSIVSYTGTGANATVGHGLGSAPKVVITKNRDGTGNWEVYHGSISGMSGGFIELNQSNEFFGGSYGVWNGDPDSSTFGIGTNVASNTSGANYIAYCFAEVKGYSKFGSYTGNGNADGTFVYTGFKPAFVIIKRTDSTADWVIMDNKRDTFNLVEKYLDANTSDAEANDAGGSGSWELDFLSNGFKLRENSSGLNASGGSYIYMAFAEEPLVGDNPATAR